MSDRAIQNQLLQAINAGQVQEVRALLAAGADVNHRGDDPEGHTPLMRAVTAGQAALIPVLAEAGADVNCVGRLSGSTPLLMAHENPELLRALIAAGADVEARTPPREVRSPVSGRIIRQGGETALHLAAAANNVEAVRILVGAGAALESLDAQGCGPLDVALRAGSPTSAAVALVEAGAELTPARLEAMHSGGHAPHSNLSFFPEPAELSLKDPRLEPRPPPVHLEEGEACTCPKCGSLIYSRKARTCGGCGATLSPALRVQDDQREILEDQRAWARDVANVFDPPGRRTTPHPRTGGNVSPEELVRRASMDAELEERRRPNIWLHLFAYGLAGAAMAVPLILLDALPPWAVLAGLGVLLFLGRRAWKRSRF